jgi:hypothetical protein
MKKNPFAGLAEAKLKSLEGEGQTNEEAKTAPPAHKQTKKQANKLTIKKGNKRTGKLANKKTSQPENLVGVTILVEEDKRIWWNVQAKLQKTTLKDAIIEALDKRFGEPKLS